MRLATPIPSAAGTAFADDDGEEWGRGREHFAQVDGDGFGDVALFFSCGEGAPGCR